MRTFAQMHADCNKAGHPCSYWGERGDWYVAAGQHRDSDILERANFKAMTNRLDKLQATLLEAERELNEVELDEDADIYAVESEDHWAVGWVEHLLINPAFPQAIKLCEEMREAIEEYPILDESLHSEMELEDSFESWDAYGRYDCERELKARMTAAEFDSLTSEQIESALWEGRRNANWEYEHDGNSCNFNTDGIVERAIEEMREHGWIGKETAHND